MDDLLVALIAAVFFLFIGFICKKIGEHAGRNDFWYKK